VAYGDITVLVYEDDLWYHYHIVHKVTFMTPLNISLYPGYHFRLGNEKVKITGILYFLSFLAE